MIPWSLDRAPGAVRLAMTDVVDVFDAAALHRELLAIAGDPRPVTVDLSACPDLDASALQLLLAFRDARERDGFATPIVAGAGRVGRVGARFGLGG